MKRLILKPVVLSQVILFVMLCSVAWSAPPVIPEGAKTGAVQQSLQKEDVRKLPSLPEIIIKDDEGRKFKGAEGVTVEVREIAFDGNEVISEDELRDVVKDFIGKTIEVNDLQQIVDKVSSFYIKKLFVLTKVYIPPQTIESGRVVVAIREGRLGKVIVRGNERYKEELIQKVMKIVRDRGALSTADLERALLLLMDYPGMSVKSTLMAGDAPGTTDIIVDVTETKIWGLGVDYNNFGSQYVARNRFGINGSLYNPFKYGDSLRAGFDIGEDDELYYGRLEYTFPVNYCGTRVGASYSYLEYTAGKELEVLDAAGKSRIASLWISHPIVRTRHLSVFGDIGVDYKHLTNDILDMQLYKDELVVLRASTFVDWVDVWNGRNYFSATLKKGVKDASIESRHEADSMFTKMEFLAGRYQLFPYGINGELTVGGQFSADRLPSGEELSVGGAGTVRGYAQSEYSGDNGVYGTLEVRVPFWTRDFKWIGAETWGFSLAFAAFIDAASVSVKEAAIDEVRSGEFVGQGFGLRFALSPYVEAKVDWARRIGGEEPQDEDFRNDGVWYFQLSAFY